MGLLLLVPKGIWKFVPCGFSEWLWLEWRGWKGGWEVKCQYLTKLLNLIGRGGSFLFSYLFLYINFGERLLLQSSFSQGYTDYRAAPFHNLPTSSNHPFSENILPRAPMTSSFEGQPPQIWILRTSGFQLLISSEALVGVVLACLWRLPLSASRFGPNFGTATPTCLVSTNPGNNRIVPMHLGQRQWKIRQSWNTYWKVESFLWHWSHFWLPKKPLVVIGC